SIGFLHFFPMENTSFITLEASRVPQVSLSAPWTPRMQRLCPKRIRTLYIRHEGTCSSCSRAHSWRNLSICDSFVSSEKRFRSPNKWASILMGSLFQYPVTEPLSTETVRAMPPTCSWGGSTEPES